MMIDTMRQRFIEAHKTAQIIERGRRGARYLMSVEPGWVFFLADGEPNTPDFSDIFGAAMATGHLRGTLAVLLNLSAFTGNVDWDTIKALYASIDWHGIDSLHIAYVVRNQEFATLTKIAGVIFGSAQHRAFIDEAAAIAWLHETRPIAV
jgi:hypothetical protein